MKRIIDRRTPRLCAAFVFVATVIAGCTTAPTRPLGEREALFGARLTHLATVHTWDITGRLAVHSGDQGGQMSLRWQREGERAQVRLASPLGQQLLQLSAGPEGARAVDSHQRVFTAPDAQSLLAQMTGWHLPLRSLNYWVLGAPVPDLPHEERLDDAGRLTHLQQLGWDIDFLDYAEFQGQILPRRLFLKTATGDPQAPLELRLVIESWGLSS